MVANSQPRTREHAHAHLEKAARFWNYVPNESLLCLVVDIAFS